MKRFANAIMQERDRGITILDGHGWYTGKDVKVICLMAKRRESQSIFRIVKIIDPLAFVSQSSVIGVYGEGFDKIKVNTKNAEKVFSQVYPNNNTEITNEQ